MKKFLIGGNFKMNMGVWELKSFISAFQSVYKAHDTMDVFIAPMQCLLSTFHRFNQSDLLKLAAQNSATQNAGAFTGESSPAVLKEIGCDYVLVGHSERRTLFGESDEIVKQKFYLAIEAGLRPILCIGESLQDYEQGQTQSTLSRQLASITSDTKLAGEFDVAYEPVWAIGSGKVPTQDYISEVHTFLRSQLGDKGSRLLYGGSVNPENVQQIIACKEVQGLLIGGASLDVKKFLQICAVVSKQ
ncbi:MAG TPA: triose-phosphate isomerase [Candidatus Absconditabacterales bacterium]|nr:triose-phosphate isomerase [Candidatus Absconditabacterales bacterium]HMT27092.1 triose-phosphate isomerase [Candidatus Absconditabacterales bacterium]